MFSPPLSLDLWLLLLTYPAVTVPILLRLETTCKALLSLVRNNQIQVWRSKLEQSRSFPSECLPLLYGNETWRDVACLWWSWRRYWVPRDLATVAVPVLEPMETLGKYELGRMREVIAAQQFRSIDGPSCYSTAVHCSGTVAVYQKQPVVTRDILTRRRAVWRTHSSYDARLTEGSQYHWTRNHDNTTFCRSNLTLRVSSQEGVLFDKLLDVRTGEVVRRVVRPDPNDRRIMLVLGNNFVVEQHVDISRHQYETITSIQGDTNPRILPDRAHFNETLAATLDDDSYQLRLHRLSDLSVVAERNLAAPDSEYNEDRRVNTFFDVYDLVLNHLYSIDIPGTYFCSSGGDDVFSIWRLGDKQRSLMVFDPMEKTISTVRKTGSVGGTLSLGYLVVVKEYAIDKLRVRTGASGKTVLYYRKVESI
ncbi:hypothetical protein HK097_000654 [Rhizophlyctis rosea]|uniref:F-box domain-containing protein n=1 Tax=Rhizophlyctis rosea TaxID=64517 RepID=A0AAD5SHC4_9FUNG|nr:hypothetical protein HK097_000654 [Rhizophlyctis rosea]